MYWASKNRVNTFFCFRMRILSKHLSALSKFVVAKVTMSSCVNTKASVLILENSIGHTLSIHSCLMRIFLTTLRRCHIHHLIVAACFKRVWRMTFRTWTNTSLYLVSFAVIRTITEDPTVVGYVYVTITARIIMICTHFGQVCRNMLRTYLRWRYQWKWSHQRRNTQT